MNINCPPPGGGKGEGLKNRYNILRDRFSFFVFLLIAVNLHAQDITQNIRGKVYEHPANYPLDNAQLSLIRQAEVLFSTRSNDKGEFTFENIPVGRYKLEVSHTSYYRYSTEIFLQSAKALWLDIPLIERVRELDEVQVSASAANIYDIPGVQQLSIEQSTRIAANFFDPVRVSTAFPGVVVANDQNNAIIVRGNSPDGLLWRLNGLDILNPNHLSNAGTLSDRPAANGGGTNILSAQMLGNTRFINGNYQPAYGNFQSAVVDMDLRESRSNQLKHTVQVSLIGLDYAAEGSLVPEKLSFTANARYSTVGLLTQMGVDFGGEAIAFKDVSGQLVYRASNNGVLKFFFLAGDSENDFEARQQSDWEEDKDRFNIRYSGKTFISGLTYLVPLNNNAMLKSGLAYSSASQSRYADFTGSLIGIERWEDFEMQSNLLSQFISINKRLSRSIWLEVGNYLNFYSDEIYKQEIPRLFDCLFCFLPEAGINGSFETWQMATYAQIKKQFSSKLNATIGLRGVKTGMYSKYNLEPRAELQFDINEKQMLSLNYSRLSRLQQSSVYLSRQNANLGLTQSHQLALNYVRTFAGDLRLRSSLYYQYLFDVPVEPGSTFSVINLMELQERGGLLNEGAGRNYGFDLSVEKSFFDDFYLLAGGSRYKSEYRDSNEIWRNTRFDGGYTLNIAAGKEWTKRKEAARKTFGLDTRLLYLGGLYEMPILESFSLVNGKSVFDESAGFTEKLPDYFRFDLRLSWRKHKEAYTRTISIDIQNLLNVQNIAYHYYDAFLQERQAQYHLGVIPILAYRLEF
ncbi:MAG TPA: carboxypeptidase regulatory-like domain-containing protein [Cyclobacteriaceae bacterium]|nr:carboxypeptidase regulatory-like domain-containing protein [Cyclobacteriaceae bacterium]